MAVGSWDPGSQIRPDAALLERLADIARRSPDDPADGLSEEEIRGFAPLMRLAAADWGPLLPALDDSLLVDLVRFFTVAEMKLTGWEGGDRSPVIAMVKVLRERKSYPSELTRWIKDRTDNRYLPYGSLLDRL